MALAGPAWSQDWPQRSVTIIVPSAPGDGSDIAARLLGDKLRGQLGQAFVVDNKMGAGGIIGTMAAAKAAPDGYTFVMGNAGSHGINQAVYTNLPYNVLKDFTSISLIYRAPNIFVVSPKLPVTTLGELVAYAKANPGKITFASGGVGSSAQMNAEYMKMLTGMQAQHVPYRGASPALNDVVSGQVDFMAGNLPPAIGLVKSGQIRPLAVTTLKRSPALPDVPTADEAGLKGFETVAWFGLFAPAGIPRPIVDKLNSAIVKACAEKDLAERLAALGGELVCNSPEEFRNFLIADIARWKEVAAQASITIEVK